MGKKRKYTEMIGVMFEKQMLLKIKEITDRLEISNSEYIRKLVEDKIKKNAVDEKGAKNG